MWSVREKTNKHLSEYITSGFPRPCLSIQQRFVPSVMCYHIATNWFSRMTNDAVVSEAEVIQSRMEDYSMACLGSQALWNVYFSCTVCSIWHKFILIFYLCLERMANKKHKCSWYCVLSYLAAKDWNPGKQFSVKMKELGLVNPWGK